MQYFALFLTVAGLCLAAPQPQIIDLDAIASAPAPSIVTPTYTGSNETATVLPVSLQAAAAAAAISIDPASIASSVAVVPTPPPSHVGEKGSSIEKRDGTCATQPLGAGPVAVPDTPGSFASNPALWDMALDAPTPDGYLLVFSNLTASLSATNYMGLHVLQSYDTLGCQSLCDQNNCAAFNVYAERDPSLDPNADNCPNPNSTTNYICTLWGVPVSASEATNSGQWRDSFQVLISASNAYNKAAPPNAIPGFSGPTELGGAIDAPSGYMGYTFYPFSQLQGYTPSTCAAACLAQTAYNQMHPDDDGSYQTCAFFNSYILSEDGVPQGLYCSLYNQTWSPQYGTNYGQYRGSDRYTVSESYSYSLQPAVSSTQTVTPTQTLTPTSTLSTCYTPTTIASPACAQVTVTQGAGYYNYYAGQGVTETTDNPGNTGYVPETVNFSGSLTACEAIQQCAITANNYIGTGWSFDVHLLEQEQLWECVVYYDFNLNPGFFNVENCDVSQAYGYTVDGTNTYVPPCYGSNNPDCPEDPLPT